MKTPCRAVRSHALALLLICCTAPPLAAGGSAAGTAAGTVSDSSGLPLPGATVRIVAVATGASAETTTDARGRYAVSAAAGDYDLQVSLSGFEPSHARVRIGPGTQAIRDVRLQIGGISRQVTVRGDGWRSPSSQVLITRTDLEHVPGGLQAASCRVITELSPSAAVAHDQLHVRGGHQIGYAIDGVEVPSTSVASNVALPVDPKNVEAIDVERGAYSAEYADRPYGMIDILTRSGFDRAKGGESTIIAGQQRTAEGALAYGDHSDRVAWFAQASGNRTDLGLTPPSLPAAHDQAWGAGGATRLWFARGTDHLLTVSASARSNDFAIPFDAARHAGSGNQVERDAYADARWTHTGAGNSAWSITPYYHFGRVALDARAPSSSDDRRVHYLGSKADWSGAFGRHAVKAGVDGYATILRDRFNLPVSLAEGSAPVAVAGDSVSRSGVNSAAYVQDVYRPASDVTASVGLRWDHAQAWRTESAVEPRAGVQAAIPGTRVRARFYAGRFFEPPPLEAPGAGGAASAAAGDQAFLLVRAERGTQWETGLAVPLRGGSVDITWYDNHVSNYLDHQQLGDSSVFLPVNVAHARLRGLEVTASSPSDRPLRARFVYAHSYAQARGAVTGGLGDITAPPGAGYYFLDHDQRDEATASLDWTAPAGAWAHLAVQYGSGFLAADGPGHLPAHVTADLAAGFSFARRWSVAADVLNLTDRRYFVNLSSAFNGTHVARPRAVTARVCARF